MKTLILLVSCGVLLLIGGCCFIEPDRVGIGSSGDNSPGASGSLKVYSAQSWRSVNDSFCYVHSDYNILTPRGQFVMNVPNAGKMGFWKPDVVRIPAGMYLVVAQAAGHGTVNIPVTIKPGGVTVLNLDRKGYGDYSTIQ